MRRLSIGVRLTLWYLAIFALAQILFGAGMWFILRHNLYDLVYYVHPREIDPAHPRLPMSAVRRFKSYVNLHSTEVKLRRILREFPTVTFREYLAMNAAVLGPAYVH